MCFSPIDCITFGLVKKETLNNKKDIQLKECKACKRWFLVDPWNGSYRFIPLGSQDIDWVYQLVQMDQLDNMASYTIRSGYGIIPIEKTS